MITKEQKQLIKEVKRESGTNEFLSVSDLMIAIQDRHYARDADLTEYSLACGTTVSFWNHFLRNTPLSMDLFIGEGAIFEGFKKEDNPLKGISLSKINPLNKDFALYLFPLEKSEFEVAFKAYKSYERIEENFDSFHDLLIFIETTPYKGDYFTLK